LGGVGEVGLDLGGRGRNPIVVETAIERENAEAQEHGEDAENGE
jgi:hypothetical protein